MVPDQATPASPIRHAPSGTFRGAAFSGSFGLSPKENHHHYAEIHGFPRYVKVDEIYRAVEQAVSPEQRLRASSVGSVAIVSSPADTANGGTLEETKGDPVPNTMSKGTDDEEGEACQRAVDRSFEVRSARTGSFWVVWCRDKDNLDALTLYLGGRAVGNRRLFVAALSNKEANARKITIRERNALLRKFYRLLSPWAVIMHITGGSPARGLLRAGIMGKVLFYLMPIIGLAWQCFGVVVAASVSFGATSPSTRFIFNASSSETPSVFPDEAAIAKAQLRARAAALLWCLSGVSQIALFLTIFPSFYYRMSTSPMSEYFKNIMPPSKMRILVKKNTNLLRSVLPPAVVLAGAWIAKVRITKAAAVADFLLFPGAGGLWSAMSGMNIFFTSSSIMFGVVQAYVAELAIADLSVNIFSTRGNEMCFVAFAAAYIRIRYSISRLSYGVRPQYLAIFLGVVGMVTASMIHLVTFPTSNRTTAEIVRDVDLYLPFMFIAPAIMCFLLPLYKWARISRSMEWLLAALDQRFMASALQSFECHLRDMSMPSAGKVEETTRAPLPEQEAATTKLLQDEIVALRHDFESNQRESSKLQHQALARLSFFGFAQSPAAAETMPPGESREEDRKRGRGMCVCVCVCSRLSLLRAGLVFFFFSKSPHHSELLASAS